MWFYLWCWLCGSTGGGSCVVLLVVLVIWFYWRCWLCGSIGGVSCVVLLVVLIMWFYLWCWLCGSTSGVRRVVLLVALHWGWIAIIGLTVFSIFRQTVKVHVILNQYSLENFDLEIIPKQEKQYFGILPLMHYVRDVRIPEYVRNGRIPGCVRDERIPGVWEMEGSLCVWEMEGSLGVWEMEGSLGLEGSLGVWEMEGSLCVRDGRIPGSGRIPGCVRDGRIPVCERWKDPWKLTHNPATDNGRHLAGWFCLGNIARLNQKCNTSDKRTYIKIYMYTYSSFY